MDAFFDEYKHLEKLCNEIYGGQKGVSLYIEDMEQTPSYVARRIPEWYSDLKNLKRFRAIRNSIAHDSDGEMRSYEEADVEALKEFYDRIMTQRDPLALRRAEREGNKYKRQRTPVSTSYVSKYVDKPADPVYVEENAEEKRLGKNNAIIPLLFVGFLLLFLALIVIVYVFVTGKAPTEMISDIAEFF